jgi:hypothetical protein
VDGDFTYSTLATLVAGRADTTMKVQATDLELVWQRFACVVAKFLDSLVQFFVQLIDLLAAFFMLPDLLGDFIDLLQDFAPSRIVHRHYPS